MSELENETKYLFLNSSNASSGTLSNFSFFFNSGEAQSFFRCSDDEQVYLTPQNAIIANDYPEIGSSNNAFNVNLPKTGGGLNTYNITLTSGNPTILGVCSDLNTQFAKANLQYNGSNLTITSSFSTQLNYLVFTLSTPVSQIQFDFSMANNCGQVLGFSPILYNFVDTSSPPVGISSIQSAFCPDVSRYSEIYIYASCVLNNFVMAPQGLGLDSAQVLFTIPITTSTGSNIIYENTNNQFRQPILNNIDRLDMSIRDRNGDLIILNNSSTFAFKLEKIRGNKAVEYETATRVASLIY